MNLETNEFEVVYDGEDGVCNYGLLDDIRNGDLSLIMYLFHVILYTCSKDVNIRGWINNYIK